MMPSVRHATACTGMASTTSFGDHHAADALGQALQPLRTAAEARLLLRLEVRADFEDAIVELVLREQRCGERAAAGAELEDRPASACSCRASVRPKSEPSSGAVTKSPCRAELRRPARVVAEAGLVQHELHVAGERNPAVVRRDLLSQAGEHQTNLP